MYHPSCCSIALSSRKTKYTGEIKIPNCNSHSIAVDNISIGNYLVIMCTSSEQTAGKRVPNMAGSIISKCSRTWSQERRIGVLHRSLEPRLSVWDCVPEHIIDAHLKDAVYEARYWLNPSFADHHASLSTSPNNAITSSIMQFPVQRLCEVFADWTVTDHLPWC